MSTLWKINGQELTDRQLVRAILNKDNAITDAFFNKCCKGFFAGIYNKYYTDCNDVKEFINEIYFHLMYPGEESKRSKLSTFNFRCTFIGWLSYVTENYCKAVYKKRQPIINAKHEAYDNSAATKIPVDASLSAIERNDFMAIVNMIDNDKYRTIMKMKYLDKKEHEEIAKAIGVEGAYYYTMHRRARAQFMRILTQEGL